MKPFTLIITLISFLACSHVKHANTAKDATPDKQSANDQITIGKETDSNEYFSIVDTNILKYKLPLIFEKPLNWKQQSSEQEWYGANYSDSLSFNDVIIILDSSDQLLEVRQAKSWCLKNYQIAFPYLVSRLSIKEKIGLNNTADLIIYCRMLTGDLKNYGHGRIIREDIFTTAGRASWILNELTGEEFASVQCDMTQVQSEHYKSLWINYIRELK